MKEILNSPEIPSDFCLQLRLKVYRGDLLMLLDVSADKNALPTTYGELRSPLGKHRLKVSQLLVLTAQLLGWRKTMLVVTTLTFCNLMDSLGHVTWEAKIMQVQGTSTLLSVAYHKVFVHVGAPPEIASLLEEIRGEQDVRKRISLSSRMGADPDPELDEFMETYCDVLVKYKSDLARPFDEATTFLNNIEMQFSNLCKGAFRSCTSGCKSR